MSDGVGHAFDESGGDRGRRIKNQFSADSAHFIVFGYESEMGSLNAKSFRAPTGGRVADAGGSQLF
jgi:hypothetical protein